MKRCMRLGSALVVFAVCFLTLANVALADAEELRAIRAAIKAKGALWTAGESWVTRLSPDERRKLLGGGALELQPLDSVDSSTMPLNGFSSPPDAIDWRDKDGFNWVTPVKHQAMCGSCIAFSAVAALESLIRIENDQPDLDIDLSEQHLFNCGGGSCSYGWFHSYACSYLKNNGAPDEECWPYYPFNEPCSDTCSDWQSRAVKISDYGSISGIEACKTYVAIAPIMAGLNVYSDFYDYEDGIYEYTWGDYEGWHGVCIVGYDTTGEVPYWIVKNSWGSSWGENGFFRIKMGECSIETKSSYWISRGADIDVAPLTFDFGSVVVGQSSSTIVSIYNQGDGELTVDDIDFSLGSSTDYSITSAPTLPAVIVPGTSADVEVAFSPLLLGTSEATLEITSDDPNEGLVEVCFTGNGVEIGVPFIDRIGNRKSYPREIIRIIGSGFGQTQGDSVVHIGPKTYDSTSPKIKLWTETKIKIKIPFGNKSCDWYTDGDGTYRKRKVWVTVDGVDSNKKTLRILKPADCD